MDGSQKGVSSPTFWSWPEVKGFRERYGMHAAHFDQGALGHALVKPTTFLVSDAEHGNRWNKFVRLSRGQQHSLLPWKNVLANPPCGHDGHLGW